MDCIPVCPTGSIDEWRVVNVHYSLEEQYEWEELPEQAEVSGDDAETSLDALDDSVAALLAEAHKGAGGKSKAPLSAAKPTINMYNLGKPAVAKVQGNYRLTDDPDHDVRHIILNLDTLPFPVLEGQSVGVIPPGTDDNGQTHLPRLYSVSSPRDGERPNFNNISLTVKREKKGLCSNYICDLENGDEIQLTGPFGATFLLPDDPESKLLMICTGTGAAPMRGFTMRRQRVANAKPDSMTMFFGARTPQALPYFGPLSKVPKADLEQHLVYSRQGEKEYVQDRLLKETDKIQALLQDPQTHIYICGLRGMEEGVNSAFEKITESMGQQWSSLRDQLREQGRFHVETY